MIDISSPDPKSDLWLEAATATWNEVAAFVQRCPAAILPLGATEQHGPHLPLATDTLLAYELALRVARNTKGLVLPALPLGYSWVWRDYPGTLTLELNTFLQVIKDIASSLSRAGVKALLILSGHGANQQPLKYAVRELVDECSLEILYLFYPGLEKAISGQLRSPRWRSDDFHADEIETSLLLAVRPDLCLMDRAIAEYPATPQHYGRSALSMGKLTRSGVFGDATAADAVRGGQWLDAVAQEMARLWEEFLIGVNPSTSSG